MSGPTRRELLCAGCAIAAISGCEGANSLPPDLDTAASGTGPGASPSTTSGPSDDVCDVVAEPGAPGWEAVALSDHPQLADDNGFAVVTLGVVRLNIAQVAPGCFVAMETACTHEGDVVEYRPERRQFVCVRHGATFVDDGSPILGPTSVPLVTYPCALDGDAVWVNLDGW